MKISSSRKRVAAIGLVTAATLVGGSMAYAYFTASGTGTGTATAGSSTAWAVDVVDNTTDLDLTPTTSLSGTPSQPVEYSITNMGTGKQLLAKAVITVASVTPGSSLVAVNGPNDCTADDFSIGGVAAGDPFTETLGAAANNYEPGDGYSGTVDLRLVDNGLNQDKCQGATVTLQVDAS